MSYRLLPAVVAVALISAASPVFAADAKDDPVVAKVNGREIHRSTLLETYESSQFRQVPLEMVYDQVLDYVVTGQILLGEAKKQNLENDPKVKDAMKAAQERILQQAYLSRKVDAEITEATLKKRYDETVKTAQPKEEVKARHILVDSEEQAKKIIADIKGGAKFEDLAAAQTKDPSGKENGGDLGFFAKDEMVAEFANAAFALKPGEMTQTPVKTQFGWHVIKVEDRRQVPPPSFEESKQGIRAELAQETVQTVIEKLQKSAKIERFDADGKPLAAKAKP